MNTEENIEPTVPATLYIIMRSDLQDMNPGKAIAQGSHATDDFEEWVRVQAQAAPIRGKVDAWRENRSFGRVIVLEATLDEMVKVTEDHPVSDLTVDETYPWRNWYGDLILSSEITCAWCFLGENEVAQESLSKLPLHR